MQDFRSLMTISVVACLLMAMASTTSFGLEDVLPSQIRDLKMGTSSSQVIDKIGSAGTHSKEVDPKDQRMKLTWQVPNSPYYQELIFGFTQKDRLYQIRFSLRQELRHEWQPLKKAIFNRFRISSEDPTKMRIKGQDVLMYMPEKGEVNSFFELTDVKTGEKWFELFNRDISFQDKQTQPKDIKKENNFRGAGQL
jgi:hypothetical protein